MKQNDSPFLFQNREWYVPEITGWKKLLASFAECSSDPENACWCSGAVSGCTMECEKCILCSNMGDSALKIRAFRAYCAENGTEAPEVKVPVCSPDISSGEFLYGELTFKVPEIRDGKKLAAEYASVMKHPGGDVCFCKHDVVQKCDGINCSECILCASYGDFARKSAAFRAFCRENNVALPVLPTTLFDRTIRFLWMNRIYIVPPLLKIPELVRQFAEGVEKSARNACWCHDDVVGECDSRQCESCLLCSNAGDPLSKIHAFQDFCARYGIELPEVHPVFQYEIPHQRIEFHGKKYFIPDIASSEKLLDKFQLEMEASPREAQFCGGMATSACIGSRCESCLLNFCYGDAKEKYQAFCEFCKNNGLALPKPVAEPDFDKFIEECFYTFEGHKFHIPAVFDGELMKRQYRKVFEDGNTGKWCTENTSNCDRNCSDCLLGVLSARPEQNLRAFQAFCKERGIMLPPIPSVDFTPEIPKCNVVFEGEKYKVPDIMSREKLVTEYTAALAGHILMECWCRNNVTRYCDDMGCTDCLLCTNQGEAEKKLRAFREFAVEHGITLPTEDDLPDRTDQPPEQGMSMDIGDDMDLEFPEAEYEEYLPEISTQYFRWKDRDFNVPDIPSADQTLNDYRQAMFRNPGFNDWCLPETRDRCSRKDCGECILFSGNDPVRKIGAFQAFCRQENLHLPDTGVTLVPEVREGQYIFRGKRLYVPEIFDGEAIVKRYNAVLREKPFARACIPDEYRNCARNCDLCILSTSKGDAAFKIEAFRQFCREHHFPEPEAELPGNPPEIEQGVFEFEGNRYPYPAVLSKKALGLCFESAAGSKLRETRWCGNRACGNCDKDSSITCKVCLFATEGSLGAGNKIRAFLEFCKIYGIPVPDVFSEVYTPVIESGEYTADGESFIIPAHARMTDTLASFRRHMVQSPLNSCWCMATEYDFCPKDCNRCLLCTNSGRGELKLTLFQKICRDNGIETGRPDGVPLVLPSGEFVWRKHTFRYPGIADVRLLMENYDDEMKKNPLTGAWCHDGAVGDCEEIDCSDCLFCSNEGPSRLKLAAFEAFCRKNGLSLPEEKYELRTERKAGTFKFGKVRYYVPEIVDSSLIANNLETALYRFPESGRWCLPGVRGECKGECGNCIFAASPADIHQKISAFLAFCRENNYNAGKISIDLENGFDFDVIKLDGEEYFIPTVMDTELMVKQYAETVGHNLYSACWCHECVPHCCSVNCNECLLCTNYGDPFRKLKAFRKLCASKKINLPRVHEAQTIETAMETFVWKDKCFRMPPLVSIKRMLEKFKAAMNGGTVRTKWCGDVSANCDNISCETCLLCTTNEDPDAKLEAFFAYCHEHGLDFDMKD